ncbi:hypothetical protein NRS6110_03438 [Bacillus subtilis]|nr:SdpC immunity factor [Bacillus subtilis subsp. subtilis str. JH642 substr. AG174]AIC43473.1 SdpC immunity factor [Bacillus subtilis subsp. subtilis str. AG1839]AOL96656.1 uncharacterized protein BS16045_00917 [Bacillus subtilis]AQR80813.1 hypothetical protein GP2222_09340 [Bacillus subtilis subsp. subtilis str. 168]TDO85218.1 SdpI/YhfL family protein [Bacillus sp. AtDRG31]TWG53256.1 SdpI/YhfL family protein [Bacillus subtilis J23]TWG67308.1 SdpI/YhfL family protein [Bacillus subtilis J25]
MPMHETFLLSARNNEKGDDDMTGLVGGGLMIIAGILIKLFPPKSINSVYGYRTRRSMSDQRLWNEANRYSASLMILSGLVIAGMGLLLGSNLFILQLILLIAACVITFMLTEKRLKIMTHSQGGDRSGRS